MDKEKSEKLYRIISLFAIIDIPVAGSMILFSALILVPLYLYGTLVVQSLDIGMAIAAAGIAVVGLIISKKGKESLSGDEKTMFIFSLLTLMFMGACAGIFGNLLYLTSNSIGPLDHIITHHISDPLYPLAVSSLPWAGIDLAMSIAGLGLSALGGIASIINIVNIKGGSMTTARPSTQTAFQANPQAQVPVSTGGAKFCAGCGAALMTGSKFCEKCGKQV